MAEHTRNVPVLNELREKAVRFLNDVTGSLGVWNMDQVSSYHLKSVKKDKMSELFQQSMSLLGEIVSVITTDFEMAPKSVKQQMFESQQTIIKLQSELIDCKNEQMETVKAPVIRTVRKFTVLLKN